MSTVPGLDPAPTTHRSLLKWVEEVAELTSPERVVWCDGSDDEWRRLTTNLVDAGTLVRLRQPPNSFAAASDPGDAARAEDCTYLCCEDEADAGPTGNWMDPVDMKIVMTELYRGSMRGRTMYVVPFCLGPLGDEHPKLGVEITDSAYVVVSMRLMTRMGAMALEKFGDDAGFVKALHSVGAPLEPGQADVPWPCSGLKYVAHFPEDRTVWSYGSGYGGNALLGKESYALSIGSVLARDEGWLAEHMLILKLTSPAGSVHYVAAAFPGACGKTTLAMLRPSLPGWKAETLGDDVAWLRFGPDGRLRAVNPEFGFFGVAPGTGYRTNPAAMRMIEQGNAIFTNVAVTDTGEAWWEGMTERTPQHLTDWRGRDWHPDFAEPAAHPGSRFCTPIQQCPNLAPEWDDPAGVPLSAILFGGRRATTVPLVVESRDWQHGVFLGATLSSETSGVVRRDPMAMRPFLGYHAGDYLAHWLAVGAGADPAKLPRIFGVNWFRRGEDGRLLWPGFRENSRVLAWIAGRVDGTAGAVDTPLGAVPAAGDLDLTGLDADPADVEEALAVKPGEWPAELDLIRDWFTTVGAELPQALREEFDALARKLG